MKISVKAHPKSRQRKVVQKDAASFEVWVTEPPDKGKANAAIAEVLAEHLSIPKSSMRLVSGQTGKTKIFEY